MGVSDFESILGNRAGVQQGYNFDKCKKGPRDLNKRSSAISYDDDIWDDNSTIGIEGATLSIEVFRTSTQTSYTGPTRFCKENDKREFENKFMKEVYPNIVDKKIYTGYACCDDWEINFHKEKISIPYFYAQAIFKLGDYLFSSYETPIQGSAFFEYFDSNTEEIWIRVWYEQAYESFTKKDIRYISDECLLHVAKELGVKNAPKIKRGKLFDFCCNRVNERYF